MAEKTPLYMDINNVYSGDEMGLPNRDFISEGIVGAGDYLVSAGAGNTVNIAAGACWILGDTDIVNQPIYRVINDAVVNKGITPDPTNPRIVLVVGQITDATFSGATRAMVLTAIHGTPAGSPVAPALPASAILLSTITVPAAAASSAAYTFVDNRVRAKVGGGQAQAAAVGSVTTIFDVVVGRGQTGDPAAPAASIDSNTILGGNIPATYRHLRLYLSGRGDSASNGGFVNLKVNNDATAANYNDVSNGSTGTGTTVAETLGTVAGGRFGAIAMALATAGYGGVSVGDIFDYTSTTFIKQWVSEAAYAVNAASAGHAVYSLAGNYLSTAAITRLALIPSAGNFIAGTRATLYGIL